MSDIEKGKLALQKLREIAKLQLSFAPLIMIDFQRLIGQIVFHLWLLELNNNDDN